MNSLACGSCSYWGRGLFALIDIDRRVQEIDRPIDVVRFHFQDQPQALQNFLEVQGAFLRANPLPCRFGGGDHKTSPCRFSTQMAFVAKVAIQPMANAKRDPTETFAKSQEIGN